MKFIPFSTALAIFLALLPSSCTSGQEGSIAWQTNFEAARRQAASENKLILLHFSGDFCRPCRNLEKFVFTNPRVGAAIQEHYIPVKVDVQAQPALAKEYGITTIPHDVVITPNGHVFAKQASSPNSEGYLRMIQGIAFKAARANPQAIANTQQIAQEIPTTTPQITNAYVPAEQTSTVPEPIRMIGNSTSNVESPVRTVSGQTLAPQANDERKFASPPAAEAFLSDLKLAPPRNTEAETRATQASNGSTFQPRQAEASAQNGLNPVNDALPVNATKLSTQVVARPVKITSDGFPADLLPTSNGQIAKAPQSSLPVGFGGCCPVTWFATGSFVHGNPQFGCEHRGRLYLFASRELRDQFQLTPDVLSPMLAGCDSVTYATTGELRDGSLSHSVVLESSSVKSIYLFSSAENKTAFLANSQKYIDEVRQALHAADQAAIVR